MFTGIVSEIGKVKAFARKGDSSRLVIACERVAEDITLGDSVAINGVCLSVVADKKNELSFDVVRNTLTGTNLKRLKVSAEVNLEKALKLGDSLSGHIVSGHIDAERKIQNYRKTLAGRVLDIAVMPGDEKYLINKGSVAVDGISLTIGEVSLNYFRIFLIPQTLDNTTLKNRKTGEYVNVEFDMMGKYAEKAKLKSDITIDTLYKNGFL